MLKKLQGATHCAYSDHCSQNRMIHDMNRTMQYIFMDFDSYQMTTSEAVITYIIEITSYYTIYQMLCFLKKIIDLTYCYSVEPVNFKLN